MSWCVRGQFSLLEDDGVAAANGVATPQHQDIGAFHGAIHSTTPPVGARHGERARHIGGMTSPVIWVVREAAFADMPAARMTLKPAHCGLRLRATFDELRQLGLQLVRGFQQQPRRSPAGFAPVRMLPLPLRRPSRIRRVAAGAGWRP